MQPPTLENWFSISIRRNRGSFIGATLSLAVTLLVVAVLLIWFNASERAGTLIFLLFLLPGLLCLYLLTGQRLRDLGITGWLALLWIPINSVDGLLHGAATLAAWIILCSVPGTNGPNRYGPNPLSKT